MNDGSQSASALRIGPLGNSLSLLLAITYLLCICFGLMAPESMRMYEAWAPLLPGFEWLTPSGFLFGLLGSYLYGWYLAILFVPLYRLFAGQRGS